MTGGALPSPSFWAGRRVFLTGHTGFKGTWLAIWLRLLGAEVTGFSDGTLPGRSLFADLAPADHVADRRGDVRNLDAVRAALIEARPDIVMHLAAQSLVRRSYATPVETFATNVMGTAHVLEAARGLPAPCRVLVVTSDKCYENREWLWGYRETEPMGGHDPYSASKGCAELVASAYARSFSAGGGLHVVSARAGNVIGGGDWAQDRLIPDLVRGMREGRPVPIRNPDAVRPWQHVLEPLGGYLLLCERAAEEGISGQGWNFGPEARSELPVRRVADALCRLWGRSDGWHHAGDPQAHHEAGLLRLDSAKANRLLGWQQRWDLDEALTASVAIYRSHLKGPALRQLLERQIADYTGMS